MAAIATRTAGSITAIVFTSKVAKGSRSAAQRWLRPTIAHEDCLPQDAKTSAAANVARIGVRQSSGLIVFAPFFPASRRLDPAERGGPDIDRPRIERLAALLG